ncbi:MAG: hypothetical protein OXC62_11605, partial [Aestuariivita sp.]|nr:hypothetical protein [Aestuariivita sp.]
MHTLSADLPEKCRQGVQNPGISVFIHCFSLALAVNRSQLGRRHQLSPGRITTDAREAGMAEQFDCLMREHID